MSFYGEGLWTGFAIASGGAALNFALLGDYIPATVWACCALFGVFMARQRARAA